MGTLAWLLTKPIARPALVLAKLVASVYAVLFLMLLVPGSLVNVHTRLVWGEWPNMPGYLIGLSLRALSPTFYVTFVLMLGTFFQRRGPVSGVAFGFVFAGLMLPNFAPKWLTMMTPWPLRPIAAARAVGRNVPADWTTPVLATVVWTLASLAPALWQKQARVMRLPWMAASERGKPRQARAPAASSGENLGRW